MFESVLRTRYSDGDGVNPAIASVFLITYVAISGEEAQDRRGQQYVRFCAS